MVFAIITKGRDMKNISEEKNKVKHHEPDAEMFP
jgi:hypothetical protein